MTGLERVRTQTQLRRMATTCVALLTLTLAACGGGSSPLATAATAPATGLWVVTTGLPSGASDAPYGPTQLEAREALGPTSWHVSDGALPPGLTLTGDGRLYGAPRAAGVFLFRVEATDGVGVASRWLEILVKAFDVRVEGLQHGDAWSGVPVRVTALGQSGSVSFAVLQNGSGGHFEQVDPIAGSATYVPGDVSVPGVVDRLRITDPTSGTPCDVTLTVAPDPLIEHDAEWGLSDVWFVDFHQKRGDHAFTSDWHEQLARVGLRHPDSTGPDGSDADQLSDMACRVAVLRHLNRMYLRNGNGSRGSGLDISFPYAEPTSPFMRPDPSRFLAGQANTFSVMPVNNAAGFGTLGIAFVDGVDNGLHVNNVAKGDLDRGVFVNRIVDQVVYAYADFGDSLERSPVSVNDMDALRALLYESGYAGGRYAMLDYIVNGLARSVAAVLAHEIGHGVGLRHTIPSAPGSLMDPTTTIHEDAIYRFVSSDIGFLRDVLPGPGRSSTPTALTAEDPVPEGGTCECAGP